MSLLYDHDSCSVDFLKSSDTSSNTWFSIPVIILCEQGICPTDEAHYALHSLLTHLFVSKLSLAIEVQFDDPQSEVAGEV